MLKGIETQLVFCFLFFKKTYTGTSYFNSFFKKTCLLNTKHYFAQISTFFETEIDDGDIVRDVNRKKKCDENLEGQLFLGNTESYRRE